MTHQEYEVIAKDRKKHYWIPEEFYLLPEPR